MTFKEFKEFYHKYGKTPGQISPPKNPMNERQLQSRYEKFMRVKEKRIKKMESIGDKMWESVKKIVYERDQNRCQLLLLSPYEFHDTWLGPLDPCHIFRKSTYPQLKYDPDNVVLLHRLFHLRLDQYKHPFTGEDISFNETYEWWKKIIGTKRFEELESRIEEPKHGNHK